MIKSNGGVFGRNPTFQDVTVDGNLTVNGDLALGDDITINDTLLVNGVATFKGGIVSTGTAAAPTSNTVMGSGAGVALQSGAIDNVLIGQDAGKSITTQDEIVVVGTRAGYNVGVNTTAVGHRAAETNTGILNTAIGSFSSMNNTGGSFNTLVGVSTGTFSSASNMVAVGYNALNVNTANGNVAIGSEALDANTTGASNTAVGHNALGANTTGANNTAVGSSALLSITTGSENVGIGVNALQNMTTASGNVAVGNYALLSTSTSGNNVAVGPYCLQGSTGSSNSGFGHAAFFPLTSGSQNVAVGDNAGRYRGSGTDVLASSSTSVFIGYQSRAAADSQSNQVVIAGTNGLGNGSNTTTIGNSSTTGTYLNGPSTFSVGANGQSTQLGQATQLLSALSGATVTATNLIPANCILLGVTARVTTAITGATTFDIGDGTTANRFGDDIAIALDTTANNCIAPSLIAAATNVVLTANGSNFTAGAVRVTAHYMTLVAPTS